MIPVLSMLCFEGQDHSGGGAAFTNNRKKILSLPTNLQGMI